MVVAAGQPKLGEPAPLGVTVSRDGKPVGHVDRFLDGYVHLTAFHAGDLAFGRFLSTGKDYRDCGRPCDTHEVKLRDRVGAEHVLKADTGCRNTVFNSQTQTGAEFVEKMLALGVPPIIPMA